MCSLKDLKTEKEEETVEREEGAKEADKEKAPEPELAPKGNKPSFAIMKHVKQIRIRMSKLSHL